MNIHNQYFYVIKKDSLNYKLIFSDNIKNDIPEMPYRLETRYSDSDIKQIFAKLETRCSYYHDDSSNEYDVKFYADVNEQDLVDAFIYMNARTRRRKTKYCLISGAAIFAIGIFIFKRWIFKY